MKNNFIVIYKGKVGERVDIFLSWAKWAAAPFVTFTSLYNDK